MAACCFATPVASVGQVGYSLSGPRFFSQACAGETLDDSTLDDYETAVGDDVPKSCLKGTDPKSGVSVLLGDVFDGGVSYGTSEMLEEFWDVETSTAYPTLRKFDQSRVMWAKKRRNPFH